MPLHSLNLICIVFHNLDAGTRKWAVAAAQEFIKTEMRPGTWVGVFNLDSRLTPLHAFTRTATNCCARPATRLTARAWTSPAPARPY